MMISRSVRLAVTFFVVMLMASFVPDSKYSNLPVIDVPLWGNTWLSETPQGEVLIIGRERVVNEMLRGIVYVYNLAQNKIDSAQLVGYDHAFSPSGPFTNYSAERMYGTEMAGGNKKSGSIFSYNSVTRTIELVYSFGGKSGLEYPQFGMVNGGAGKMYGIAIHDGSLVPFKFDIANKSADRIILKIGSLKLLPQQPIADKDFMLYFPATDNESNGKSASHIVVYNSRKSEVEKILKVPVIPMPASHWVMGGDGCLYTSNHKGFEDTVGKDFQMMRVNPKTGQCNKLVAPPEELTVLSIPLSPDKEGNLYTAYTYGGPDNCGHLLKYDYAGEKFDIVKTWKNDEAGCVTTGHMGLLFHSSGVIVGASASSEYMLYRFDLRSDSTAPIALFRQKY